MPNVITSKLKKRCLSSSSVCVGGGGGGILVGLESLV